MPRYTVHIRNENDEKFSNEPEKSGLLNDLLKEHYKGQVSRKVPKLPEGTDWLIEPDALFGEDDTCIGHPNLKMDCMRLGCKYGK